MSEIKIKIFFWSICNRNEIKDIEKKVNDWINSNLDINIVSIHPTQTNHNGWINYTILIHYFV